MQIEQRSKVKVKVKVMTRENKTIVTTDKGAVFEMQAMLKSENQGTVNVCEVNQGTVAAFVESLIAGTILCAINGSYGRDIEFELILKRKINR